MSQSVNAPGTSIRPLATSELDEVAGGVIKTPPVCKPVYRPASIAAPTP